MKRLAPNYFQPVSQLYVSENSPIKSLFYEVTNGKAIQLTVTGGVKANANPTDATIIWYRNSPNRQFSLLTTNKFEAWNLLTFPVTVIR